MLGWSKFNNPPRLIFKKCFFSKQRGWRISSSVLRIRRQTKIFRSNRALGDFSEQKMCHIFCRVKIGTYIKIRMIIYRISWYWYFNPDFFDSFSLLNANSAELKYSINKCISQYMPSVYPLSQQVSFAFLQHCFGCYYSKYTDSWYK